MLNSQFKKATEEARNIATELIKDYVDGYRNFYIENGWNTKNIVDNGYIVDIESGQANPYRTKGRGASTSSPQAAVLIKKKAFSSLKFLNDIRYMSKNEVFLLRATKALFALKVSQIRVYETIYKTKEFAKANDNLINVSQIISLIDKINRANSITFAAAPEEYSSMTKEDKDIFDAFVRNVTKTNNVTGLNTFSYQNQIGDMLSILKRNIYSSENLLTTFIVDYSNIDNYGTGPGTGVIELTNFSSFSTNLSYDSNPSGFSLALEDPYNISIITEADIDLAIREALNGDCGIFKDLLDNDIKFGLGINEYGLFSSQSIIPNESSIASGTNISNLENFYSKVKKANSGVDIDYVFERLRVFYLGKPYVNPPDTINVFINGNSSRYFDKESGTPLTIGDEINGIDEKVIKAEMEIFTSGEIDFETYKSIRSTNEYSLGMTHVFAGFVTSTSTSYSNGSYKLNFSCTDNMGWLNWAKFNETPSIDDPQGVLEDPLTPFKIPKRKDGSIDLSLAPELLDENKDLIDSGMISYDSGVLKGQNVNGNNIFQSEFSGIGSTNGQRVLQHTSGFIYDWKSGILTATAGFEPTSSDGSKRSNYKAYTDSYVLPTVKNVLNNLDVANIISILSTGKPYNVANFLKNAKEAVSYIPESDLPGLKNVSQSPLSSVLEVIKKQNNFYGGFIPYKMITVGAQSYQKHISNSALKDTKSSQIKELELKRAEIRDQIDKLRGPLGTTSVSSDNIIKRLELEIQNITEKINNEVSPLVSSGVIESGQSNTPLFVFGDPNNPLSGFAEEDEDLTKIKSIIGAKRRIEDVRLNIDKNYFIVSDQYDASVEIKPFLLELKNSGYKLFQSSYANNFEKCRTAAAFLNLEFFCNSQGHLELRPPQWNKIPLTILKSLIKTKKTLGKNVIPDYIMNMYETKEKNLSKDIQRLNIRICMIALLLGKYPDVSIIPGLSNYGVFGKSSLSFFGISKNGVAQRQFDFSTNNLVGSSPDSSEIGLSFDFSDNGNIVYGDTEAILGDFEPELVGDFNGVKLRGDTLEAPRTLGGSGIVNEILIYSKGSISAPAEKIANAYNLNKIRIQAISLFGIDPASGLMGGKDSFDDEDFVFRNKEESHIKKVNRIIGNDSLLSKLRIAVADRDKSVILLKRNKEKRKSFEDLNHLFSGEQELKDPATEVMNRAQDMLSYFSDNLNYSPSSSSPYDELVEDDTRNILGYGSGKRFIVKDEDIISATYNENPPDYTRVNVTGSAELGFAAGLESSTEGFYLWAGGTDFDLWRQYGYKSMSFNVPFFSSAEKQCKPYSYFMLQLQRSKINTASLQLRGNEFYQPGDVIYVESKGLLYYVKNVNHSFNYGQSFTTTLSLEYGHAPGIYMPNPLDLFGMQLTENIAKDNIPVYRNSRGDDYYRELAPESCLKLPGGGFNDLGKLLSHSDNQSRFYSMISGLYAGQVIGGDKKLLIRGFVRKSDSKDVDKLRDSLNKIKQLFMNPQILSSGSPDRVSGFTTEEFLSSLTDYSNYSKQEQGFAGKVLSSAINSANPLNIASGRLVPLKLPNGQIAPGISEGDIIIQISYLDKEKDSSEISCFNPDLSKSLLEDDGSLTEDAKLAFPLGGMRQGSWLDLRQISDNLSFWKDTISIAEIGIIDLKIF